jgi:hypothetical protein
METDLRLKLRFLIDSDSIGRPEIAFFNDLEVPLPSRGRCICLHERLSLFGDRFAGRGIPPE